MNVPAVSSSVVNVRGTREAALDRPSDAPNGAPGAHASGAATAAVPARPPSGAILPVQAPAGTDSALWSILTAEERTFFARHATSGPLTYLKVMMPHSAPTTAMRGRRIDVRV